MQFFRKSYVNNTVPQRLDLQADMVEDFQSLNFVDYVTNTNQFTQYSWTGFPELFQYIFKWHKENTFSLDTPPSDQWYYPPFGFNLIFNMGSNQSGLHFYDGRINSIIGTTSGSNLELTTRLFPNYFTSCFNHVWFIPLNNSGFLLSTYWDYLTDTTDPTNTIDYHITPKFFTCSNYLKASINAHNGSYGDEKTCHHLIVGIYNNVLNSFSYYQTSAATNTSSGAPHPELKPNWTKDGYIDYQNRAFTDHHIPFSGTTIDDYQDSDQWIYTNYSQNVCTLIHMPYGNKFLDNMFICTTCPNDHPIEGQFFSFSGRNFLGFYKNLVVELPSG